MKQGLREQILHASIQAQEAFWAEITKQFPQATTGDIAGDVGIPFDEACNAIVSHWVDLNVMNKGGL